MKTILEERKAKQAEEKAKLYVVHPLGRILAVLFISEIYEAIVSFSTEARKQEKPKKKKKKAKDDATEQTIQAMEDVTLTDNKKKSTVIS